MGVSNSSMESRLQAIEQKLADSDYTVSQSKKEIETLKSINAKLHEELKAARTSNKTVAEPTKTTEHVNIDEYINKLLEDPDVNIPYLPDYVERQIYKNVFTKIYGLLANILGNAEIKLPGDKNIKFRLE